MPPHYYRSRQATVAVSSTTDKSHGNDDVYRNQQWCNNNIIIRESICIVIIRLPSLLVCPSFLQSFWVVCESSAYTNQGEIKVWSKDTVLSISRMPSLVKLWDECELSAKLINVRLVPRCCFTLPKFKFSNRGYIYLYSYKINKGWLGFALLMNYLILYRLNVQLPLSDRWGLIVVKQWWSLLHGKWQGFDQEVAKCILLEKGLEKSLHVRVKVTQVHWDDANCTSTVLCWVHQEPQTTFTLWCALSCWE